MQEYDYRISHEAVNEAGAKIDRLSNRQLVKLSETAEELQQTEEKEHLIKAKEYFDKAILPGLQDFAEMSGAVLSIEEHDEKMAMQANLKCDMGFDITESCRLMRSLLLLANFIGIMKEGENILLSLIYEYKEMLDY